MIKRAGADNLEILSGLAVKLWPHHSQAEMADEFSNIMKNEKSQFFLKYENDLPVGFAQCQLRQDYVEGTSSSPVGYVEGIFVCEEYRGRGYARELLTACEDWARQQGCHEFASDCELDNESSLRFHQAMHFAEVNRVICFAKML